MESQNTGELKPFELLSHEEYSSEEMAAYLGVSCEEIERREQAGELFSYCRQSRGLEKLYPAYQLAPEIYPDLIRRAREMLDADLVSLHFFFTQRDPDLGNLSVREVLAGHVVEGFELDEETAWLVMQPLPRRMEAVMGALGRMHAVSQGW